MKRLLKDLFCLRSLSGAEFILGQDGIELIRSCSLHLNGDQLSVRNKQTSLKNLPHFGKNYEPDFIAICLTGKGILTKKLEQITKIDQSIIQQALPNSNPEDFYYQAFSDTNYTMVSVIRRGIVDRVIGQLQEMGFKIVSITLEQTIDEKALELDKEILDPILRPAYYCTLQVLLGIDTCRLNIPSLEYNRIQAFAKAKVKAAGLITALAFFCLLLINSLLVNYFNKRSESLVTKKTSSIAQIKQYQQMETALLQKSTLIKNLGWIGGYNPAWLTDQLMLSKPAAVTLSMFSINPVSEKGNGSMAEKQENKLIMVGGTCDQAATLNNWLIEIRSKTYVQNCMLNTYELNRENGKGQFTIQIKIKDYEGKESEL